MQKHTRTFTHARTHTFIHARMHTHTHTHTNHMQMKRAQIAKLERKKNFFSTTLVLVFLVLTWLTSWVVIFSSHYHHSLLFNPVVDPWTDNVIGICICVILHLFVIGLFIASQFVAEICEFRIFKAFISSWQTPIPKWLLEAAVPEVDIDEECYELEAAEAEGGLIEDRWVTVTGPLSNQEVPKGSLGKVIKIDEHGNALIDFDDVQLDSLVVGCRVRATRAFTTNIESAKEVLKDSQGVVAEIDDNGDALIGFEGLDAQQLVLKSNFGNISVLPQVLVSRGDFRNISVLSQVMVRVEFKVPVTETILFGLKQVLNQVPVPRGSLGKVIQIVKDGNGLIARIKFENLDQMHNKEQQQLSVSRDDFKNISVLSQGGLAVGRWVTVMVPFISLDSQYVPKGSLGNVIKINGDGDVLIDFEDRLHLLHPILKCDGCEMKPIRGARWKCGTCANFDLCDGCHSQFQATGQHHTHEHEFKVFKDFEDKQWVWKGDLRNIWVLNPLCLAAQKAEEEEEEARKKAEEEKRLTCRKCKQRFASRNKLHKHLESDHQGEDHKAEAVKLVAADETMGREMSQAPQGAIHVSAPTPPAPARATIGHLVSRSGASESAFPSESKHSPQPSPDRQGITVEESLPPPCHTVLDIKLVVLCRESNQEYVGSILTVSSLSNLNPSSRPPASALRLCTLKHNVLCQKSAMTFQKSGFLLPVCKICPPRKISAVCLLQDLLHSRGGVRGDRATRDDEPKPVWTSLPITH